MSSTAEKRAPPEGESATRKRTRRRTTFACARCHQRKIRCDNAKPVCLQCKNANVPCLGILDGETKTVVPRSIIHYLQEAIATTEIELRRRNIRYDHLDKDNGHHREDEHGVGAASGNDTVHRRPESTPAAGQEETETAVADWLASALDVGMHAPILRSHGRRSSLHAIRFPVDAFLFSSSGPPRPLSAPMSIPLHTQNRPRLAAVGSTDDGRDNDGDSGRDSDRDSDRDADWRYVAEGWKELSQVPYKVAELLVHHYVQKILPSNPFLDPDGLYRNFQRAYDCADASTASSIAATPFDIFVTSMMLCVTMMTSRFSRSSRFATSRDRIFRNCLRYAQHHLQSSSIQTLQCLLLISQYCNLMPDTGSIWETVSLGMRMAVELGLHRDAHEVHGGGGRRRVSDEMANFYRRMFWCVYEMDRSICATSHNRLGVSESSITTRYPDGLDKTAFMCVISFRRIQSEIMSVNFWGDDPSVSASSSVSSSPSSAYNVWLGQTERKIRDWRQSITSRQSSGPEWFDIAYHHGLVFLHRPSPRNPCPSLDSLSKCYRSAVEVVSGYWENIHSGMFKYNWHAVYQGFESAVVMLYALRKCRRLLREEYGIYKILETVHTYSSLFVLLGERWDKAIVCYETYERLKATVLRQLIRSESDNNMGRDDCCYDGTHDLDELDRIVLPSRHLGWPGSHPITFGQPPRVPTVVQTGAGPPALGIVSRPGPGPVPSLGIVPAFSLAPQVGHAVVMSMPEPEPEPETTSLLLLGELSENLLAEQNRQIEESFDWTSVGWEAFDDDFVLYNM